LPESQEQRNSAVVRSAGEPGPLSRLLQEIFEAPSGDLLDAWKKELQPGDRVGRFEIRREVGRGGFGAVYEAFDTELNRVVAVKTLRLSRPRQDLSSDWIKKEAEAVARLDHPCIVTLFDVGTCDSGPYLVMELLRGKTLAQRIAEGPIPVTEALRIAEEMAKGLAHAHQRGVLHRDLKPANVFLCEDGRVKLLDFGLAHLLGTEGVSGAGTPAYMAPEQARGQEVDQRADVYAAGRVLGDMLGERRPRRLEKAVALATSTDPAARPRDGQAWLDLLLTARQAVERPARMRRVAVLAGLGVMLGGVVVGVVVHRASRPVSAAHGKPSIAVLPFADMSPGKDQEYLSDGVAEEILTALARVPGLWVPGRTSSFYFKGKDAKLDDIGRELKVDHVLEGSVRRAGNKVRVSAEVVKAGTGERVWSQTFDRELSDIFAVQDEIAGAIVEALRVKFLSGVGSMTKEYRPTNQDAYQSYLLGKHFRMGMSDDSNRRAIAALQKAVELDPNYPQAWAALGRAYVGAGVIGAPFAEVRRKAHVAVSRAIELAPDLPDVLAARAGLRLADWDWTGAKADLDRALEIDPENAAALYCMAEYLTWMGRLPEVVTWDRRRVEKEPLSSSAWNDLGVDYWFLGRFDEAESAFSRAMEVDPSLKLVGNLGPLLLSAGRPREALDVCKTPACRAMIHHALGDAGESQKALDELLAVPEGDTRYVIARVYSFRGETDRAFEWLELAREGHVRMLNTLKVDPSFRPLHSDPRWAELLRKMNLPVD
jgi:serine/threonine-protein kinase